MYKLLFTSLLYVLLYLQKVTIHEEALRFGKQCCDVIEPRHRWSSQLQDVSDLVVLRRFAEHANGVSEEPIDALLVLLILRHLRHDVES